MVQSYRAEEPGFPPLPPVAIPANSYRHICMFVHGQWRRFRNAHYLKLAPPHLMSSDSLRLLPPGRTRQRCAVRSVALAGRGRYRFVALLSCSLTPTRVQLDSSSSIPTERGANPMRITLNSTSASRLLRIMSQPGVTNPTHIISPLLNEAAMQQRVPVTEDVYDHSNNQQYAAT